MVAPFAMEPKGTVQSRMVPIAKLLEKKGFSIDILIPPYDNALYSGKIFEISKNIKIINLSVKENLHIGFNLKFILFSIPLIISVIKFVVAESKKYDVVWVFKPKGLSGIAAIFLNLIKKDYVLDTDDWEGKGGWNDKANYNSFFRMIFEFQ